MHTSISKENRIMNDMDQVYFYSLIYMSERVNLDNVKRL